MALGERGPWSLLLPSELACWPVIKELLLDLQAQLLTEALDIEETGWFVQVVHDTVQSSCLPSTEPLHEQLKAKMKVKAKDKLHPDCVWFGMASYLRAISQEERESILYCALPRVTQLAIGVEDGTTKPSEKGANPEGVRWIPRHLACSVLACSFLCLLPEQQESAFGKNLNFTNFFRQLPESSQVARLQCFLHYFDCMIEQGLELQGDLSYYFKGMSPSFWMPFEDLMCCDLKLCPFTVHLNGRLGDSTGKALQVDFSSQVILGDISGQRCLMEDISLCTCPELIAAMLLLGDPCDQAVVISGFEQYSWCSGSSDNVQYGGHYLWPTEDSEARKNTRIVIGSHLPTNWASQGQNQEVIMLQELNKALLAFSRETVAQSLKEGEKNMPLAITAGITNSSWPASVGQNSDFQQCTEKTRHMDEHHLLTIEIPEQALDAKTLELAEHLHSIHNRYTETPFMYQQSVLLNSSPPSSVGVRDKNGRLERRHGLVGGPGDPDWRDSAAKGKPVSSPLSQSPASFSHSRTDQWSARGREMSSAWKKHGDIDKDKDGLHGREQSDLRSSFDRHREAKSKRRIAASVSSSFQQSSPSLGHSLSPLSALSTSSQPSPPGATSAQLSSPSTKSSAFPLCQRMSPYQVREDFLSDALGNLQRSDRGVSLLPFPRSKGFFGHRRNRHSLRRSGQDSRECVRSISHHQQSCTGISSKEGLTVTDSVPLQLAQSEASTNLYKTSSKSSELECAGSDISPYSSMVCVDSQSDFTNRTLSEEAEATSSLSVEESQSSLSGENVVSMVSVEVQDTDLGAQMKRDITKMLDERRGSADGPSLEPPLSLSPQSSASSLSLSPNSSFTIPAPLCPEQFKGAGDIHVAADFFLPSSDSGMGAVAPQLLRPRNGSRDLYSELRDMLSSSSSSATGSSGNTGSGSSGGSGWGSRSGSLSSHGTNGSCHDFLEFWNHFRRRSSQISDTTSRRSSSSKHSSDLSTDIEDFPGSLQKHSHGVIEEEASLASMLSDFATQFVSLAISSGMATGALLQSPTSQLVKPGGSDCEGLASGASEELSLTKETPVLTEPAAAAIQVSAANTRRSMSSDISAPKSSGSGAAGRLKSREWNNGKLGPETQSPSGIPLDRTSSLLPLVYPPSTNPSPLHGASCRELCQPCQASVTQSDIPFKSSKQPQHTLEKTMESVDSGIFSSKSTASGAVLDRDCEQMSSPCITDAEVIKAFLPSEGQTIEKTKSLSRPTEYATLESKTIFLPEKEAVLSKEQSKCKNVFDGMAAESTNVQRRKSKNERASCLQLQNPGSSSHSGVRSSFERPSSSSTLTSRSEKPQRQPKQCKKKTVRNLEGSSGQSVFGKEGHAAASSSHGSKASAIPKLKHTQSKASFSQTSSKYKTLQKTGSHGDTSLRMKSPIKSSRRSDMSNKDKPVEHQSRYIFSDVAAPLNETSQKVKGKVATSKSSRNLHSSDFKEKRRKPRAKEGGQKLTQRHFTKSPRFLRFINSLVEMAVSQAVLEGAEILARSSHLPEEAVSEEVYNWFASKIIHEVFFHVISEMESREGLDSTVLSSVVQSSPVAQNSDDTMGARPKGSKPVAEGFQRSKGKSSLKNGSSHLLKTYSASSDQSSKSLTQDKLSSHKSRPRHSKSSATVKTVSFGESRKVEPNAASRQKTPSPKPPKGSESPSQTRLAYPNTGYSSTSQTPHCFPVLESMSPVRCEPAIPLSLRQSHSSSELQLRPQGSTSPDLHVDVYQAAVSVVQQVFHSVSQAMEDSSTGPGAQGLALGVQHHDQVTNLTSNIFSSSPVRTSSSPKHVRRSVSPSLGLFSRKPMSREMLTNAFLRVDSSPSLRTFERRSSEPCQTSVQLSLQAFNNNIFNSKPVEEKQRKMSRTDDDIGRGRTSWRRGSLDGYPFERRRNSSGFKDPVLSRFAEELMRADTSVPELVIVGSHPSSSTTDSRRSSLSGFRDMTLANLESELLNTSFTSACSLPMSVSPRSNYPAHSQLERCRSQEAAQGHWRSDSSDTEYWFPPPRYVGEEFQMELSQRQQEQEELQDYASLFAGRVVQEAVCVLRYDSDYRSQEEQNVEVFADNLTDQIMQDALRASMRVDVTSVYASSESTLALGTLSSSQFGFPQKKGEGKERHGQDYSQTGQGQGEVGQARRRNNSSEKVSHNAQSKPRTIPQRTGRSTESGRIMGSQKTGIGLPSQGGEPLVHRQVSERDKSSERLTADWGGARPKSGAGKPPPAGQHCWTSSIPKSKRHLSTCAPLTTKPARLSTTKSAHLSSKSVPSSSKSSQQPPPVYGSSPAISPSLKSCAKSRLPAPRLSHLTSSRVTATAPTAVSASITIPQRSYSEGDKIQTDHQPDWSRIDSPGSDTSDSCSSCTSLHSDQTWSSLLSSESDSSQASWEEMLAFEAPTIAAVAGRASEVQPAQGRRVKERLIRQVSVHGEEFGAGEEEASQEFAQIESFAAALSEKVMKMAMTYYRDNKWAQFPSYHQPMATASTCTGVSTQLQLVLHWLAASVAGCPNLDFFTQGDLMLTQAPQLVALLQHWTVAQMATALRDYSNAVSLQPVSPAVTTAHQGSGPPAVTASVQESTSSSTVHVHQESGPAQQCKLTQESVSAHEHISVREHTSPQQSTSKQDSTSILEHTLTQDRTSVQECTSLQEHDGTTQEPVLPQSFFEFLKERHNLNFT